MSPPYQYVNMGGTIMDICPSPLRLVSPSILLVTYQHHLRPNLQPPKYDYISGPFYMDPRYGYYVYGQSYGACYWGKGRTVYGSLCTGIYHSVRTPLSVLSYFLFAERTHY
eukprot:5949476-Pleurochrysis_carterae.AAC.1